ncbi:MAG: hypothetical protein IJL87_07440 [Clostridia bacterium]|nr:hypothetical protein [Clostridia bacterium]
MKKLYFVIVCAIIFAMLLCSCAKADGGDTDSALPEPVSSQPETESTVSEPESQPEDDTPKKRDTGWVEGVKWSEGTIMLADNVSYVPFTKDESIPDGQTVSAPRRENEDFYASGFLSDRSGFYLMLPVNADLNGLYNVKNGKRTLVEKGYTCNIRIVDDKIYYLRELNDDNNGKSYFQFVMKKNGKETVLADCEYLFFIYCKDFVMYSDYHDGKSYKLEYENNTATQIPYRHYLFEYKDRIYYYNPFEDYTYSTDKSLEDGQKVVPGKAVEAKNDCLYTAKYRIVQDTYTLSRFNLETGEYEDLVSGLPRWQTDDLAFTDNYLLVFADNTLYKIGERFDKIEKVFEVDCKQMNGKSKGLTEIRARCAGASDNRILIYGSSITDTMSKYYQKTFVIDTDGNIIYSYTHTSPFTGA